VVLVILSHCLGIDFCGCMVSGKAYLARRFAIPTRVFSLAMILELAISSLLALGGLPVAWQWGGKKWELPSFDWRYYLLSVFAMTTGWVCFGAGFWALAASFQSLAWNMLPTFLFAIVGAFSISLAVLFVPGGIGVRESVMTFLLSPLLGSSAAVLVATLSRLILISCEYVSVTLLFSWRTRKTP